MNGSLTPPLGMGGCEEGCNAGLFFLVDHQGGITMSHEGDRRLWGAEKEANEYMFNLYLG